MMGNKFAPQQMLPIAVEIFLLTIKGRGGAQTRIDNYSCIIALRE